MKRITVLMVAWFVVLVPVSALSADTDLWSMYDLPSTRLMPRSFCSEFQK